jgi:hypothetical protein
MLKRFWRPETGIFLGIWLVLMVGGRSRFLQDPGTFWHTVVGEHMLATWQPIYRDTFSFTFAGEPWIPHQWLGECLMAAVHRVAALDSLLLATVTLLACLYTWVAHRLIRAGLHWSLAMVIVGLTLAASSSHFHIRPHIGTIVLLGCTVAFLGNFEAGRIGIGRLAWLVPLFLLWSNIHGGMLGGLATMMLAVAGWCAAKSVGQPSPITRYGQILPLGLLIVACGMTAFVNPFGWRLPWTWVSIMDSPILPTIIEEHAPLRLSRPDGLMVVVFGVVYLIALLGVLPRWPRVTWLLPVVWFCLACTRVRHAPLFSITAAMALADMLPHTRWAAWLARPGSDLFRFPDEAAVSTQGARWQPALLPFTVILAAMVLQAAGLAVPVLGRGWAQPDPAYWPVELLPELRSAQASRAEERRIFNEYLFGGFLIYYTPGYRVFVDDRCELYGDQWLLQFNNAEKGQGTGERIKQWECEYGFFGYALTETGSSFDRYFDTADAWTCVQRTQTATLYQRTGESGNTSEVNVSRAGKRPQL